MSPLGPAPLDTSPFTDPGSPFSPLIPIPSCPGRPGEPGRPVLPYKLKKGKLV